MQQLISRFRKLFSYQRIAPKHSIEGVEPRRRAIESLLNSDRPEQNPENDALGYRFLAEQIARSVSLMSEHDGLVIGLYGAWGAGKSTALAFIKHYIKQIKENQPTIVDINPWWFSNHDDLAKSCLSQLAEALSQGNENLQKAGKLLETIASTFEKVPLNVGIPGISINLAAAAKIFGANLAKESDIPRLKREISETIFRSGERIVIFVDDIDRLSGEQIRSLFRVIKALGDFPNVTYILAFDKEIVSNALQGYQNAPLSSDRSGNYLEKIIQVPFELPTPNSFGLQKLFVDGINKVYRDVDPKSFDQERFAAILHSGLFHYINTPRDIVRIVNSLTVTYPTVQEQVDPIDFLAIETLRVLKPTIYSLIRENKDYFAGATDRGQGGFDKSELSTFHNEWASKLEPPRDREAGVSLLKRLFPKLEKAFGGAGYSFSYEDKWRRLNLICHPDKFDAYFRFAIPDGTIAANEIKALLEATRSRDEFAEKMLNFARQGQTSGTSLIQNALQAIRDRADEIPLERAPAILDSLLQVGDDLIEITKDEQISFFDTNRRIAMLFVNLLNRLSSSEKFASLKTAFSNAKALRLATYLLRVLGREVGKYGSGITSEDPPLALEQIEELETILTGKIKDAYASKSIEILDWQPALLTFYKQRVTEVEFRRMLNKVVESDQLFLAFLRSYVQTAVVTTVGESISKKKKVFSLDQISELVDTQVVFERLKQLREKSSLSAEQKEDVNFALDWTLKVLNGKDPED